eukprot:1809454-Amphidinium_carterae.1
MAPDYGKLPAAPAAKDSQQRRTSSTSSGVWSTLSSIRRHWTQWTMLRHQMRGSNRRFTDYSVKIIVDPSETPATINISDFAKVKSIWWSTMPSCFGASNGDWLANHLVDYSIISSSIYQYINSLLVWGHHTSIRQKLKYFIHNVFPSAIKPLLISPSGEWISYKDINVNLQHKAHMAIKFKAAADATYSDVEDEEPSTKRIKSLKQRDSSDNIQQGTIMHFNKGSTVTVNINQKTISNRPTSKQIDINDSRITGSTKTPVS